ncbi:hypothetical protein A4X09_0g650 [Tilletia walkeri]|uniref:Lipocalin/cytosolic fatty-acid binding domain-containing protein n=1 Tax=Tilletia walkeri TaxID=117179 RepID=A0A8X7NGV7_9BASI|nr:hypothetical protein A4X09_0g650 [Tilletia walkeri]
MYIDTLAKQIFSRFLFVTSSPTALLTGRTTDPLPVYPPGIGPALFDGSTNCTFPAPEISFNPSKYVGTQSSPAIWYQLAASHHPYEEGCSCTYAKYAASPTNNGSILLENFCTRTNGTEKLTSSVLGVADSLEERFGVGSYRVQVGRHAAGECGDKSPNYVVGKVYMDEGDGPYQIAVVGQQNFGGWFLLSRKREIPRSNVDRYLKDIASLGFDLSKPYSLTEQGPSCPEPKI